MPEQPKYTYYTSLPMTSTDICIVEDLNEDTTRRDGLLSIFDKLAWRFVSLKIVDQFLVRQLVEKERDALSNLLYLQHYTAFFASRKSSDDTLQLDEQQDTTLSRER